MELPDGRILVAAYLKQLRLARGIEQEELASRLGVHKSTILRAENVTGREVSDKMEIPIAMTRALGGDVMHLVTLRAEKIPEKYPLDRLGLKDRGEAATIEVAADVAKWHVEEQDKRLRDTAKRRGLQIAGLGELTRAFRWAAFLDPDRALKVYL